MFAYRPINQIAFSHADTGTKEAQAVMLYFTSMPGLAVSRLRISASMILLPGATLVAYAVLVTTMYN